MNFNQDISGWNVGNVTQMGVTFLNNTNFNQDFGNWNVSKVEHTRLMFSEATSFNGDISTWDVSNISIMTRMFRGATSFAGDLSDWDVSNVITMVSVLDGTKLSTSNYDRLLTKWAALPDLKSNVILGAQGLRYCDGGLTGRATLINDKNWTISGDQECPR